MRTALRGRKWEGRGSVDTGLGRPVQPLGEPGAWRDRPRRGTSSLRGAGSQPRAASLLGVLATILTALNLFPQLKKEFW